MRPIFCILFLPAFLAVTRPASAAVYSAEATAGNQNASIGFDVDSQSGTSPPVQALAGRKDPANPASEAAAGSTSGRGSVFGNSVTSSRGQRFVGVGFASATYDDIVFSWTGDGPAPTGPIRAGLNYNFSYDESASGALGNRNGINYRYADYTVTFAGQSESRIISIDVAGSTIPPDLGNGTVSADVPIDAPASVTLLLTAGSSASTRDINVTTTTSMTASLQVTSVIGNMSSAMRTFSTLSAPSSALQPLVFELPEGYTVNSESMGVVDNVWVARPVPEPATVTSMLAGLAVLTMLRACRRRDRKHALGGA